MKKCPVHNCPAKTGRNIAIIVGSVLAVFSAVMIIMHFLHRGCSCDCE